MPIRYSGAPYCYTQIDMSTRATLMSGLTAAFLASGWSDVTSSYPTAGAHVALTFTGQPTAAQTCVFDGQTYTARAARSVAGEFTIGVDFATTAANLAAEINAVQASTLYAVAAAGVVTVYDLREAPHTFTASEGLGNATLNYTTAVFGAVVLRSGKTPQGLQCLVRLADNNTSGIECQMSDIDGTGVIQGAGTSSYWAPGARMLEFFGCKYQFFTSLMWAGEVAGCVLQGGVPFIRDVHVAPVISAVANNGGAYQVTTATPHGRVTGDHVHIAGAEGNPAINGWWPITVLDTTNYMLNGSTYAGGYAPNSARAAGPSQIARCYWEMGDQQQRTTFRTGMGNTSSSLSSGVCLNQYAYGGNYSDISLAIPVCQATVAQVYNFGGFSDIIEARLCLKPVSPSSPFVIVGELWNTFIACANMDRDTMKDAFNGFNWICYGGSSGFSIWIVRGVAS